MVWPIGQPPGLMREIALESRQVWLEVLEAAQIWHWESGSLHLAYQPSEWEVLQEFVSEGAAFGYETELILPDEVLAKSPLVKTHGLLGALWSPSEVCVNPRTVLANLPGYLAGLGVDFSWGIAATQLQAGRLRLGNSEIRADRFVLCTGDDFETLYPEVFSAMGMTKVKLQMMKARPKSSGFRIGSHLCAGLTLGHYANFEICPSLEALKIKQRSEYPGQAQHGVHLLVSQHENGDLTIGDSHEYRDWHDPFLTTEIDELILSYLDTFLDRDSIEVTERWHGVYAKHPEKSYVLADLEPGITALTGVGGAGMTLSFGLAQRLVAGTLKPF